MGELVDTSQGHIASAMLEHMHGPSMAMDSISWRRSGFAPPDQPKARAGAGVC